MSLNYVMSKSACVLLFMFMIEQKQFFYFKQIFPFCDKFDFAHLKKIELLPKIRDKIFKKSPSTAQKFSRMFKNLKINYSVKP